MRERDDGAQEGAGLAQPGDAPLLQTAGQGDEDMARRLCVGQGAMAGRYRGAEGLGHRAQPVVGQAREPAAEREAGCRWPPPRAAAP